MSGLMQNRDSAFSPSLHRETGSRHGTPHRKVSSIRGVVFSLMCLSVIFTNMPDSLSSQAAVVSRDMMSNPGNSYDNSYLSPAPNYVLRGDWESPDILLLVDNHEWRGSLEKIIISSQQDNVPVYILVDQEEYVEEADEKGTYEQLKGRILRVSFDTPWIRDYGPIQLRSSENRVYWLDFGYSRDRPNDDSVPWTLAEYIGIPIEHGKYFLEGGAIISNGRGLCAITDKNLGEASVSYESSEDLEAFRQRLGCRSLAILPALTGESTGHADIIAQFYSHDTVAVSVVDQEVSLENAAELDRAVEALVSSARSIGQKLRIIRLPMHVEGENYYSYVNGTRLNNTYLVPSFESVPAETEKMTYRLMRSVLHNVRLVPVQADRMVQRGGAVHCITLGLSFPRASGASRFLVQKDGPHRMPAFLTLTRNQHSIRN